MPASYVKNLDGAQQAKRRRMLAAIHLRAAESLAATGDWRATLSAMVGQVSKGRAASCKDLYFDELQALLDTLSGRPVREPHFRDRLESRPVSQPDYLRRLIGQVNARSITTNGPAEFAERILTAKVGTADPDLMTTKELRQAITILRSYVK